MYALLIVLMALGLFVAFLYAGTNYLNIDNYVVKSNESTIESTVLMLASQFTAYENLKGYQLPKNNWQAEIFAINRFTPRTLENTVWSYDNTSGYYFCLSGNITQNQYRAFKAVEKNIEGKAFVNTTCGSLTSLSYNGTYPANVAITFWIRN